MKSFVYRILSIAACFVTALAFQGCVDNLEEAQRNLSASPSEFNNVSGTGETLTINVESNLYWNVSAQDADGNTVRWIEFDKTNGMGSDRIQATVSPSASARSCSIIIQADGRDEQAVVKVNQAAGTGGAAEGYEMPVYDIFMNVSDSDPASGPSNGFIDGNSFYFNDGISIARLGGESGMQYLWRTNFYEIYLNTTGWDAEDAAWEIAIPVAEALSGPYRIIIGSRSSADMTWNMLYSNDGETYAETGTGYSTSGSSRFKTMFFEIAADKAVNAGGTLYLKMVPESAVASDVWVSFDHGLLLTDEYPDPSDLPEVGGKVLYTCGFDNVNTGAPYTLPIGYLRTATASFDGTEYGITKSGTVVSTFGSVRLGTGSASATITLPALELLGDGTADVKLTFKSVLYQSSDYTAANGGAATSAIEVRVADGNGTVENPGVITNVDTEDFTENSVIIKSVDKNTRLQIGSYDDGSDHRFYVDDIVVEVEGEISLPDVVERTVSEVISEYGASLSDQASATVSANIKTTATVVSDRTGGNIENGLTIVQDAGAGIALSGAGDWSAGDELELSLMGAQIARDGAGYVLTLAENSVTQVSSGNDVTARTVSVSDIADNENVYVAISNCQVHDSDLSKTWAGSTLMENASKQSFSVRVNETAAFADDAVPSLSGTIYGIVRDGVICPRNADDVSGLVLDRITDEGIELMTPIVNIINIPAGSSAASDADNLSIEGNALTFSASDCSVAGAKIELVGGTETPDMAVGWAKANSYFNNFAEVTYVGDGAYLQLSTPVAEDLSGRVQVVFSITGESKSPLIGTEWNVFWSKDGNTWIPTETTYNNANRNASSAAAAGNSFVMQNSTLVGITQSQFTIPAADRIPSGGTIYFKIAPSESGLSGNLRLAFGFYISSSDIVNTIMPEGDNILASNNFETCAFGPDYMIGTIGYMGCVSKNTDDYDGTYLPAGWSASLGYVRCGYAFFGSASGTNFGVTTPALEKIGAGSADIKVSFKACLYEAANGNQAINGIVVDVVEGDGQVGELQWETDPATDYFGWHNCSVTITGATSATKVFIGAGPQSGDKRFFLDDVLVTK